MPVAISNRQQDATAGKGDAQSLINSEEPIYVAINCVDLLKNMFVALEFELFPIGNTGWKAVSIAIAQ